MGNKLFEIRNTLDAEEYRLMADAGGRIYHIELLSETLDYPFRFLQINYLFLPNIIQLARYQIRGRFGVSVADNPVWEKVDSDLGKPYLKPEQFDRGLKQASDELKERFDVTRKGRKYVLTHKPSSLAYSIGPQEGFPSVLEVSTIPDYRRVHQALIEIDTENFLDINETFADQIIAVSGTDFTSIQLETYRPSDKYPISRRRRFK